MCNLVGRFDQDGLGMGGYITERGGSACLVATMYWLV